MTTLLSGPRRVHDQGVDATRPSLTTIDCDPGFSAAYLRSDHGEHAFIETHTAHALPRLLAALRDVGAAPEAVRWIVVTHAHLDHAAGASALMNACPNATLLAHPRAARHLTDPAKLIAGATAVCGRERFAQMYGQVDPIPEARVQALEDGATFGLGTSTLQVHHTEGHANHHFVVHDPALATVFTGDAFGLVYPALQRCGRFAIASTSPVGFDADKARASLALVMGLGASTVHPTHFGEVSGIAEVAAQVGAWVDRAEAWVDAAACTDDDLATMTTKLSEQWRAAIAAEVEARALGFDAAAWDLLALDIELNAQGLAVVAERVRRA